LVRGAGYRIFNTDEKIAYSTAITIHRLDADALRGVHMAAAANCDQIVAFRFRIHFHPLVDARIREIGHNSRLNSGLEPACLMVSMTALPPWVSN
jgi:hypothetical protein